MNEIIVLRCNTAQQNAQGGNVEGGRVRKGVEMNMRGELTGDEGKEGEEGRRVERK